VDNTKTRRPQPRSNTKNDRVPSASKSSYSKNKEVGVEEYHRKLLLSRNKKHMSSKCNNVKLATQNVKSKVVCAMCKQCLIFVNHDVCLLKYVNGLTSRGKKQKANVSIQENQKKQNPKSPAGRLFDLKGKIITSKESESQSDCSKGYNACTSNPLEPTIKWFPNSTLSLAEVLGTVRFRNDHIVAILGFGDLQWGNILITRVYFVEGLGQNLFSMGKFCDSNLEYVLVIVEDYSRYTLVHFLRSKYKAPKVIKTFLKRITILLQYSVIIIRTDNGTEFKNQVLKEYFDCVGISHQVSSVRTPQQNRVVERRNRTLVEAARTMLIFSRASLFLWAEAIATACFTQNRSIIHRRSDISFLHSVQPKDKKIIESMNVTFDELSIMAFEHRSAKPGFQSMTSGQISSGLDLTYAPSTITTQQPTEDTAPTPTNSSSQATNFSNSLQDVDGLNSQQQHAQQQGYQAPIQPKTVVDNVPNAMFDANTFVNPFATPSTSDAESSSSQYVDPSNMHTFYQPYPHEFQWTNDHPLEQALYGLKQAPRAWYDELLTFLLHNHFLKGTTDPTLLIRRFVDEILVVHVYVDDIIFGSTHPRPDIVHATCSCAWYQANPTEKHLKEVKRIFHYLQGTVNTSLWYTKDSGFELTGFSDADYAGCKDTFKSTSGGAQFLGEKLVSWSLKKQDCTTLSTAKA
nr:hypothetical protein [Tanacetum cinerariifolium]